MQRLTRNLATAIICLWLFAQDGTGWHLAVHMTAQAQQAGAPAPSAQDPNVALAIKPGFDVTQVNGFIHYLYYQYSNGDQPPPPLKPEQIYDPYLLALIQQDRAVAETQGHAPLINVDPICLCQDFDALQVSNVNILHQDPFNTIAKVTFKDDGNTGEETYDLVRYGNRWFVHDILGGTAPSLRKYLIQGLVKEGVTPPKDSGSASTPLPGLTAMAECEGSHCGVWWFVGSHGEARWESGAVALITLSNQGNVITVKRLDLPQQNAFGPIGGGLTASYTGTRSGDTITNGTVTWTFTNGQKVSGTWQAKVIPPTVGAVMAQAKKPFSGAYSFNAYDDALSWIQGGAISGNSALEVDAAILYLNFVVPLTAANEAKARNLLFAAAASGNVEAEINLAQLYEYGRHGMQPDRLQSEAWFSKAGPTGQVMLAEAETEAAHMQAVGTDVENLMAAGANEEIAAENACTQSASCRAHRAQIMQEQQQEEDEAEEHLETCRQEPDQCD